MTTASRTSKECFVCGLASQYPVLTSTNEFGYRDLDFRPAEMRRSSMVYWVQECPNCGYVSSDVSRGVPFVRYVRSLIQSDDYLNCGDIPFGTQLAKRFFRQFYLLFEEGRLFGAFHAILAAAWCCDDAAEEDNAYKCRLLALELFPSLRVSEEPKKEETEDEENEREALLLIRADLLRRTGQFNEVIRRCFDRQFHSDRAFDSIAKYQVELALSKDKACHTIEEALKNYPLPGYRYYSVLIEDRGSRSFYYLAADGEEYAVGDYVLVPFGDYVLKGEVIQSEEYAEDDLPLPLSKMKTIFGPYRVEIDRNAADYQPQAAAHCDQLMELISLRGINPILHYPNDAGYEWLKPGECCIFVPNPYGDEPLRIHCGDDYTLLYREWRRRYDYPLVPEPEIPMEYARNEVAYRSERKLCEHLLSFMECRQNIVLAYVGDSFVGGAYVNSTTARRSLPEVLLNKVTTDPAIIRKAKEQGARLEIRSWQSMLDHTKVLEPRNSDAEDSV